MHGLSTSAVLLCVVLDGAAGLQLSSCEWCSVPPVGPAAALSADPAGLSSTSQVHWHQACEQADRVMQALVCSGCWVVCMDNV